MDTNANNKPPSDRYNVIWIIFCLLGISDVLPLYLTLTSSEYFKSSLNFSESADSSAQLNSNSSDNESTFLQSNIDTILTVANVAPLIIFSTISTFLQSKNVSHKQLIGYLLVILAVEIVQTILLNEWTDNAVVAFIIQLVLFLIANSSTAMIGSVVSGLVGIFPQRYTTAHMIGQGLSFIFTSVALLISMTGHTDWTHQIFIFFLMSSSMVFITVCGCSILPKFEFVQFYTRKQKKEKGELKQSSTNSTSQDATDVKVVFWKNLCSRKTTAIERFKQNMKSLFQIFLKVWVQCTIGFVVLAVRTITVPSIVGRVVPLTLTDGLWMHFFSPVFAYLLLAVSDTFGRFATLLYVFPSARCIWLLLFVGLYTLFLPAFLFCNVQPRSHLPVVFKYDAIFIVLVLVFAMMGGYLRTICSCHITQIMPVDKVNIAGEMVNLFSVYGSILGFLAFLFTAIV